MLTETDVRSTVAKAVNFFGNSREPHALLWLDVMHRRFGIEEFADALERFDAVLAGQPDDAPVLRVLRRIADANNPTDIEDWKQIDKHTDRMLVSALYSDRIGMAFDDTRPGVAAASGLSGMTGRTGKRGR